MNWYQLIKKPTWAPAENVFGQVWGALYPIIFAANIWVIYMLIKKSITWKTALPFWVNLFFNFLFTPLQFGLKNNLLALIDVALLLATGIWAMVSIWSSNKIISLMFVPYMIWVCIALALQASITWLNR